jgi:hypothetical protein
MNKLLFKKDHKSMTKQRRYIPAKPKEKVPQQKSIFLHAIKSTKRFLKHLPIWADIFGVIAFFYLGYQVMYELVPEIEPDAAISTSYDDLPITAKDRSPFFDIQNVKVFIHLENVTWKGEKHHYRIIGELERQIYKAASIIPATETITFPCEVATQIRGHDPDNNNERMPVELIRLHIRINYVINILGINWYRQKTSQSFTWRNVSGGYQWLKGDISDVFN